MKALTRYPVGIPAVGVIICVAFLLTVTSCTVRLLPDYDASIADEIVKTSLMIDRFYSEMLELSRSGSDDRAYRNFSGDYIEIELALRSLYMKNSVRPLNKHSTRICEIALELWEKYRDEHKEDELISDGEIIINRRNFQDLFRSMLAAEEWKERGG
jgi:hypothetical protein